MASMSHGVTTKSTDPGASGGARASASATWKPSGAENGSANCLGIATSSALWGATGYS
jgi:hypothetical protein